ncbi:hypothetical protein EON65_05675 [archaeon]|nr:MAG: hypothetical protein EON65_05675 [archaeon]
MSDRLGLTKLKQKDIEFKADINLRGADNMELEKVQTQAAGPQFAMLALFAPDSNCQGPIDVMMSLKLNTCEQMSGKFSRMVMYTGENNGELNLRMEIFANRNCRGAPIQVENNFGDLPAACDHGSFQVCLLPIY